MLVTTSKLHPLTHPQWLSTVGRVTPFELTPVKAGMRTAFYPVQSLRHSLFWVSTGDSPVPEFSKILHPKPKKGRVGVRVFSCKQTAMWVEEGGKGKRFLCFFRHFGPSPLCVCLPLSGAQVIVFSFSCPDPVGPTSAPFSVLRRRRPRRLKG